jgi:cellulose synthase/poly-beta-1,6-N-acetylglucosamine synthase-like glycosyltransferase
MMNFLQILFWLSLVLIGYTYILFPVVIYLRGRFFPRPYQKGSNLPSVSMVMAVHNEEDDLPAKLENIRAMEYPEEKFQVVIASDGSTDQTNEILRQNLSDTIKPLLLAREGKARALNAAVENSQGEILVFSDANSIFAPEAIKKLVEPFADPRVGGVAGNQVYLSGKSAQMSQAGEKKYWNFDRQLKMQESRAGNVISATGSIYAIRRCLFQPIIDGVTDDFYTSTAVIQQGYRLVFAPDAVSREPVAADAGREFQRKVRIITRGLRSVIARRALFYPFRYGFYSIQLFSHKVLRRLVVFPLLVVFITSCFLWQSGWFYALASAGQAAFYAAALLGFFLNRSQKRITRVVMLPYFFTLVNIACMVATWNILTGQVIARWEPQRQGSLPEVKA